MDRQTAKRSIGGGLIVGMFAIAIFSLSFVAAGLYIAQ